MFKTSKTAKEITESIQPSFTSWKDLTKWKLADGSEKPVLEKVNIDDSNKEVSTFEECLQKLKMASTSLTRQDDIDAYVGTEHVISELNVKETSDDVVRQGFSTKQYNEEIYKRWKEFSVGPQ